MKTLAENILILLGGANNIKSITHCATRLRPIINDYSKVKIDELKSLKGVIGVVNDQSKLQIIIGTNVGEICKEVEKLISCGVVKEKSENSFYEKKDKKFNVFLDIVVSIFAPLLPIFAGAGLLRGFTILANEVGILSVESNTNLILTLAGTSVFYFLPLLVAVSASKKFNASPYIAVTILGTLMMPDFIKFLNASTTLDFFGIKIIPFNYTGQILHAIVAVYIQSKIESFMKKKVPSSLHLIVIPTILLFIMVPLVMGIIGPIGNYISIFTAKLVENILSINSILSGAILAGIWNILIMFGIHWAPNTTVIIPTIALTGKSSMIAYGANANFGMAGAAFAVFLKTRNKELKNFALTSITSVMLSGIVEPAIYGLGIKYKTPLIAGCLGAALGGAFMGAFNVVGYAFVFGGLTTIPAFAGATLWAYVTGLTISFVSGVVLTFILGFKEN